MTRDQEEKIRATQAAYQVAAKEVDQAQKRKAPPEELRRLRDICEQREVEYEQAIADATVDTLH